MLLNVFLLCILLVTSFESEFTKLMNAPHPAGIGLVAGPKGYSLGVNEFPTDRYDIRDNEDSVYFSKVFTNGTVLQRGPSKAALYGSAPPSSIVSVQFAGADGSNPTQGAVMAGANGDWKWVFEDAYSTGGNYTAVVSCDSCVNKQYMYNITFGDVWYCAGQSNMELALRYTFSRNQSWDAVQAGNYSNIRFFKMPSKNVLDADLVWVLPQDVKAEWVMDPDYNYFHSFSAVCFYYAMELTNRLGPDAPPFGLIHAPIGGTMVEAWSRNHTLDGCQMSSSICGTGKLPCGGLYNGMVAPFLNSTIKGVLWFQGENNMHEDKGNIMNNTGYACMFNIMKDQWRHDWSVVPGTTDSEFGWGIVTLQAGTDEGGPDVEGMRWAQTQNYGVIPNPSFVNGFMAQGFDLGDPWNGKGCWAGGNNLCSGYNQMVPFSSTRTPYYMGSIHPRVKFEIARRLAVSALHVVYDQPQVMHTGPTIASCNYTKQRDSHNKAHYEFTIQFNTTLLNPRGMINGGMNKIYVAPSPYKALNESVLKILINDTWVPVHAKQKQNIDDGVVTFTYQSVDNPNPPSGLRYAWESNCCPGLDHAITPCIPRACPIVARFNTSAIPKDIQVGLEEGLPANPFWADLVADDETHGHCVCKAPQVCS